MNRRQWKVHAIFDCQDCDWYNDDWQTAVDEAREHAKSTDHSVNGEVGYAVRYNEKPD